MKSRALLLGLSLAANLALVAIFIAGSQAAKPPPPPPSPLPAPVSQNPAPVIGPEFWASLTPGDLPKLAERLRAEGFPPMVVGLIVAGMVHDQFELRRKALKPEGVNAKPYWQTSPYQFMPAREEVALYREEARVVRSLLRPEENIERLDELDALRRQFPTLAPAKLTALLQITEEFDRRESEINDNGVVLGPPLPGSSQQLVALRRERQERIAGILIPQEMEEYNLRLSETAGTLRNDLAAFGATEYEFRTLFRLRQEFDLKYGDDWTGGSPEAQRARFAAEEKLEEAIKTALGEARFEEFQRASDSNFRQTSELVGKLGQPPEVTNQVWDLQAELAKRRSQLVANRSLPAEQRSSQLAALAEEAKAKLTTALGERGYQIYRQNNCGWWLLQIESNR